MTEYSKEDLIQEAIKKAEALDNILEDCMKSIIAVREQRKLIWYLLWLATEKSR